MLITYIILSARLNYLLWKMVFWYNMIQRRANFKIQFGSFQEKKIPSISSWIFHSQNTIFWWTQQSIRVLIGFVINGWFSKKPLFNQNWPMQWFLIEILHTWGPTCAHTKSCLHNSQQCDINSVVLQSVLISTHQ